MDLLVTYTNRYRQLLPKLDERSRRLVAGADARAFGRGGISFVSQTSSLDRKTVARGIDDLDNPDNLPPGRCRKPGGGRKRITVKNPTIIKDLEDLIEDESRGDPESPLRWTTKSTRQLLKGLQAKNHPISSQVTVASILKENDYSLQSNLKAKEGQDHPDRDAQFRHINSQAKKYLASNDPVISVDTKKKELIGKYKNNGQTWLPKGEPIEVNTHDFPDPSVPKAVPYGVYDLKNNRGFVNVGINHDTSEFAVNSIQRWWTYLGKKKYPNSKRILITADAGGSNGYRLKLWKRELQELADKTGLDITVTHFPPGTSKWNKIEHRLFSFISTNWKGRPLTDYETIINSIASTKTEAGLKVYAVIDKRKYKLKKQVTDKEMAGLNLTKHKFHGEWNYTIKSRL